VIVGPSGSFGVMVEKSPDLNTWSAALLQNTSDPVRGLGGPKTRQPFVIVI
jgi:hypothetical protein